MFQLNNFYVLYVLNTSHKLCMKLHMVFELSISFPVFKIPPPPGHCAGGTHPTGMHSCCTIIRLTDKEEMRLSGCLCIACRLYKCPSDTVQTSVIDLKYLKLRTR